MEQDISKLFSDVPPTDMERSQLQALRKRALERISELVETDDSIYNLSSAVTIVNKILEHKEEDVKESMLDKIKGISHS